MVRNQDTALLVDAGISGKKIFKGLEETETDPEKVAGLFITHEHSDHVKSLRIVTKKIPGIITYANEKTWECIDTQIDHQLTAERKECFASDGEVSIGDIRIKPFHISHDAAEPVGYSFCCGDKQISVVTDTGYITQEIFTEIKQADLLILEANHEVNVLKMCRYPYSVKHRILGEKGHLSNEGAAECICRLAKENPKERKILLGHLSNENNTPELAYVTIKNLLEEEGIYIGNDIEMEVICRDTVSDIYSL